MNRNIIYAILLAVLSIFIVLINSLCIYVISTSKRLLQNPPTLLITNLIATHLAQGVIVLPAYAMYQIFDKTGWVCDSYRFTYMLTFYGSCINVLLLSIDRLLAIKLLTAYRVIVTRSRVMKSIVVCWVYVSGICLIPFLPLKKAKSTLHTGHCKYNQPELWSILMIVFNTLLPYIFIVFSYVLVRQKIYKMHKFLTDSSSKNEDKPANLVKITKTTLVVLGLVLCYAITWAPSIVYMLVQHLKLAPSFFNDKYYQSDIGEGISFFVKYVNFLDAIVAPIIYCFNHDDFRSKLNKIMSSRNTSSANEVDFKVTSSQTIAQDIENFQHNSI